MDIPWKLMIAYSVFSFFAFYQKLHVKNFQGRSQGFLLALIWFAFVTMVFGFGFLLYWGWQVSWVQAILVFVMAFVVQMLWFVVEAGLGLRHFAFGLSMLGFLAIPVSGIFMWLSLP